MVKKVVVDGVQFEIDGIYYNDTPAGKYEFYDVFHRGICLNEGDPLYRLPSKTYLTKLAKGIRAEYANKAWKPLSKSERGVFTRIKKKTIAKKRR
jgi:hypothetical protein